MYYPVLRGKQFELLALRELVQNLSIQYIKPIIEPVRNDFTALSKTIKLLNDKDIEPIIIINPFLGDFSSSDHNMSIYDKIKDSIAEEIRFLPCISTRNINTDDIEKIIEKHDHFVIFIESDFESDLMPILEKANLVITTRYRKVFRNIKEIVIIEDGFNKKTKNSDYDDISFFSELHSEFKEIGQNIVGFGDYTITGSQYSESGGPAYVVTIHLSYIDSKKENAMFVRHFKSYDNSSPTQPGAKFGDALDKLIDFHKENSDLFFDTFAINEFKRLSETGHFPGLGIVKKLSISHHIETLCSFLEAEGKHE